MQKQDYKQTIRKIKLINKLAKDFFKNKNLFGTLKMFKTHFRSQKYFRTCQKVYIYKNILWVKNSMTCRLKHLPKLFSMEKLAFQTSNEHGEKLTRARCFKESPCFQQQDKKFENQVFKKMSDVG